MFNSNELFIIAEEPLKVLYHHTISDVYRKVPEDKIPHLSTDDYIQKAYLELQNDCYDVKKTTVSKLLDIYAQGKFIAVGNLYKDAIGRKIVYTESQVLAITIDNDNNKLDADDFKNLPVNGFALSSSYGFKPRLLLFNVLSRTVNSKEYDMISIAFAHILKFTFNVLGIDLTSTRIDNIIGTHINAQTYLNTDNLVLHVEYLLQYYNDMREKDKEVYIKSNVKLNNEVRGVVTVNDYLKYKLFDDESMLRFANHVGFIPTKYQLEVGITPNKHDYGASEWYNICYGSYFLYNNKFISYDTLTKIIEIVTGKELFKGKDTVEAFSNTHERSLNRLYKKYSELGYCTNDKTKNLLNQIYSNADNDLVIEYKDYLGNTDLKNLIKDYLNDHNILLISPMGSGKTHTVLHTIAPLLNNCNLIITLPTIDTTTALYNKYVNEFNNLELVVSFEEAKRIRDTNAVGRIIFTSVDKFQEFLTPNDYLVIDEVHNILDDNVYRTAVATNIFNIINKRKNRLVIMTGTPQNVLPLVKDNVKIKINCVCDNIKQPCKQLNIIPTTFALNHNLQVSINLIKEEINNRDLVLYYANNKDFLKTLKLKLIEAEILTEKEILVITSTEKSNVNLQKIQNYKLVLATSIISSGISINNTYNSVVIVANTKEAPMDAVTVSQSYHRFRNGYVGGYLILNTGANNGKMNKHDFEKTLYAVSKRAENLNVDVNQLGFIEKRLYIVNNEGQAVLDTLGFLTNLKKTNDRYYLYNVDKYYELLRKYLPNISIIQHGTLIDTDSEIIKLPNNCINDLELYLNTPHWYATYFDDRKGRIIISDFIRKFMEFTLGLSNDLQLKLAKKVKSTQKLNKLIASIKGLQDEDARLGVATNNVRNYILDKFAEKGMSIEYKGHELKGVFLNSTEFKDTEKDIISHVANKYCIGNTKVVEEYLKDYSVRVRFSSGGQYHTTRIICQTPEEIALVNDIDLEIILKLINKYSN